MTNYCGLIRWIIGSSSQKRSPSWQQVRCGSRYPIFNVVCLPEPYGSMLRSPFLIGKTLTSPSATDVMKNRDAAVSLRLDGRVIAMGSRPLGRTSHPERRNALMLRFISYSVL